MIGILFIQGDVRIPKYTISDEDLSTPELRALIFEKAYQFSLQAIAALDNPRDRAETKRRQTAQWPPPGIEKAVMHDDDVERR